MAKILVVDDEVHIGELIVFNLEKEGHRVRLALTGLEALDLLDKEKPDLMVLDLMLPEMDGLEICRRVRQKPDLADIPIIMLTAKSEEFDKVLGLELGADDYLTKPFSPRELVARVKARLRRSQGQRIESVDEQNLEIAIGEVKILPESYEVYVRGQLQDLTLKEFELLKLLMSNPGKVFTRDLLLDRIWGFDYSQDTRTVDVHIRHLRQKIEIDPGNPKNIETVRGVGYRFRQPKIS